MCKFRQTFAISIDSGVNNYQAGNGIAITNDTIEVGLGNGLEFNESKAIQVKLGVGLKFDEKQGVQAISIIIFPFNGAKLTIPRSTGFDNAFENSEYVTASEFITST